MDYGLFLDTRLVREHVSEINAERRIALRLYETVKRIRDLSDPTMYAQLNRILNDIDRERVYFEKMADALEDIELKALQISSKISSKIESDAERAESVINKSLML